MLIYVRNRLKQVECVVQDHGEWQNENSVFSMTDDFVVEVSFLILLSPYCMLSSSMIQIEWNTIKLPTVLNAVCNVPKAVHAMEQLLSVEDCNYNKYQVIFLRLRLFCKNERKRKCDGTDAWFQAFAR